MELFSYTGGQFIGKKIVVNESGISKYLTYSCGQLILERPKQNSTSDLTIKTK